METQDFRLTDRPVRPPGHVPFYRRFAKQIIFSVVGSMIAGMLINATSLVVVVRYGSAVVTRFLGDPFAGKKWPWEEMENKARQTASKAPGLPVSLNPLHQTPEELEARARLKEQERERKEAAERSKYIARADAVGLTYGDDWTLDDFKVRVPVAEEKSKEAEERKPLLAQAKELKMLVDEDWDNKMLKSEILEEKAFQKADLTYQEQCRRHQEAMARREELIAHGPNAKCPTPRCGYSFRTGRTKGQFICPRCRGIFPITQAKACHTPPPMPKEPFPPQRKTPGFFKRTFG